MRLTEQLKKYNVTRTFHVFREKQCFPHSCPCWIYYLGRPQYLCLGTLLLKVLVFISSSFRICGKPSLVHAHENVPGSLRRSLLPRSLESFVNRIGSDYRVSVDCLHNPVSMVHEISTSVVRSGFYVLVFKRLGNAASITVRG